MLLKLLKKIPNLNKKLLHTKLQLLIYLLWDPLNKLKYLYVVEVFEPLRILFHLKGKLEAGFCGWMIKKSNLLA